MTNIFTSISAVGGSYASLVRRLLCGCLILAVALAVLVAPPATAADTDTYEVRVDVASRSLDDRRAAAQEGLRTVLTRLTGQVELADSAALRRALTKPADYYSRFRYLRSERYDDLGNPVTVLSFGFSPTAVRRLMGAAQLPLWTLNRPSVVVWVAENGAGGADLLADPEHPLLAQLQQRAQFRGLPLVLPTLDAQDLSRVSPRDITARRQTKLLAASKRYGAQTLLVGQIEQVGLEDWRVRWTSWIDGESRTLTLNGSPSNVAHAPVDMVTDALASRFTVAGGELGMLRLQVSDVASVADYGGVLRYLESLSYVDNVTLVGVNAGGLELDVATSSTAEKFMQLLAIESRLLQRPTGVNAAPNSSASSPASSFPEPVSLPFASQVLRVAWQG